MAPGASSSKQAHLILADGSKLEFNIRTSSRARSARLKISARDGLIVTVPRGVANARVMEWVRDKTDWIAKHLDRFDGMRRLAIEIEHVRPEAFALPALAESWTVEYRATGSRMVNARTERPGRIVISGAIDDIAACQTALRRWLVQHGKVALAVWLGRVAQECGLRFSRVSVRNQRTRWGSCSARGNISLNCALLFLTPAQVRYVLVHELCHTLERNHSVRYWAQVRQFEPDTDALRRSMRAAGKAVPFWVQSEPGSRL